MAEQLRISSADTQTKETIQHRMQSKSSLFMAWRSGKFRDLPTEETFSMVAKSRIDEYYLVNQLAK